MGPLVSTIDVYVKQGPVIGAGLGKRQISAELQ